MTAAIRYVTLTGTLTRGNSEPATGHVLVGLVATVQAPGVDQTLVTQATPVELDAEGSFAVPVPVSNDPNLAGQTLVELQVLLDHARPETLVFPILTPDDSIDLSEVTFLPVESEGPVPAVPWSIVGHPGGVAPLDLAGKIPAEFLPGSAGGSVQYHQETPAAVWGPIAHGLGGYPAAVSLFSADFGQQYEGFAVQHLDEDTLRIAMDQPTAGVALIR